MAKSQSPAEGPFNAQFQSFAKQLDAINERRERIVKASRDVTYHSKKLIFALHRITPHNRASSLSKASADAGTIRAMIASRIAPELDEISAPRFYRAYSPGMQEYVEAVTFLGFLSEGRLWTPEELQRELDAACIAADTDTRVPLNPGDYVLGIADLTGELMRVGVAAAGQADRTTVAEVCEFMRQVESGMAALEIFSKAFGRDYESKMRVLRQSLQKVERTCFDLTVRRAEFGEKHFPVPVAVSVAVEGTEAKRRRIG